MSEWSEFDPEKGPGLLRLNGDFFSGIVARARFAMDVNKLTESPIETLFGVALLTALAGTPYRERVRWGHFSTWKRDDNFIDVVAQYPFGHRFRMDWAILIEGEPAIFIECDGQEFHASEEQIANDRAKDKAAREVGIDLMRFTGSQLHRSDEVCASMVVRRLETLVRA